MEATDLLMLILFLIIQVFIGGMIFNGLKKLFRIIARDEKLTSRINLTFLVLGVLGLSFFLVINTLKLIDNIKTTHKTVYKK